jgi:hypothetical protein
VLLLELCSLEFPLGELLLELDAEWCSVVVVGASTIGAGAATTIGGGGATTTGTGYTATTGGAGAAVVVSLELVVLLVCAKPTATLPNNTAIPRDKAAVLNEFFTMTISASSSDDRSIPE